MFAPRFIPRAFPAIVLGAGLLLAGCGESPTAPQFEELPTVEAAAEAPTVNAGRRMPGRRLPGEQLAGRRMP